MRYARMDATYMTLADPKIMLNAAGVTGGAQKGAREGLRGVTLREGRTGGEEKGLHVPLNGLLRYGNACATLMTPKTKIDMTRPK
jgi:hypothetical protein